MAIVTIATAAAVVAVVTTAAAAAVAAPSRPLPSPCLRLSCPIRYLLPYSRRARDVLRDRPPLTCVSVCLSLSLSLSFSVSFGLLSLVLLIAHRPASIPTP